MLKPSKRVSKRQFVLRPQTGKRYGAQGAYNARYRRIFRPGLPVNAQYRGNIGAIHFCTASNALILDPSMTVTNWLFVIGRHGNLRPARAGGVNKMRASRMNTISAPALGIASALILASLSSVQAQSAEEGLLPPDFSGTWTRKGDITPTGEHDPTSPSTFQAPPDGPSTIVTSVPHYGHCDYLPPGVLNSDPCPPGVTQSRESNAWIQGIQFP